jgi:hypothetical protein
VAISIQNPRRIPFVYNLYCGKAEVQRGFSDSLVYVSRAKHHKPYSLSIRYLWGGEIRKSNYQINTKPRELTLTPIEPITVNPGAETELQLQVTDYKGRPVKNVDVTAYGITKKFEAPSPRVPRFTKRKKGRPIINNFEINRKYLSDQTMPLKYMDWVFEAGIDSIEHFRFLYPLDSVYRFEYATGDGITQFAPYAIQEGRPKRIHIIYVDQKPIYFDWTTNPQPYAFQIDSGYHDVEIRTTDHSTKMDSVYFNFGKKLILSIDLDSIYPNVQHIKKNRKVTPAEQRIFSRYAFPYRSPSSEQLSYIKHGKSVQVLGGITKPSCGASHPT